MRSILLYIIFLCILVFGANAFAAESEYVGSATCAESHEKEYNNFQKLSKRPQSIKAVQKMAKKLTAEELAKCYNCHTTGYGKGGFVSMETTPHLADAGCETCHGPGRNHVEAGGDPAAIIGKPQHETCLSCHDESRGIARHRFSGTIYSGAH